MIVLGYYSKRSAEKLSEIYLEDKSALRHVLSPFVHEDYNGPNLSGDIYEEYLGKQIDVGTNVLASYYEDDSITIESKVQQISSGLSKKHYIRYDTCEFIDVKPITTFCSYAKLAENSLQTITEIMKSLTNHLYIGTFTADDGICHGKKFQDEKIRHILRNYKDGADEIWEYISNYRDFVGATIPDAYVVKCVGRLL